MKCRQCGAWNQAYLPKCVKCGAPLFGNTQKPRAWEDAMHEKKPSLQITQFDEHDDLSAAPQTPQEENFDPDRVDRADLTDEIETLKRRREEGAQRIAQMKEQAERVRKSIRSAQIIRPVPEADDMPASYAGDSAAIRRRQQRQQERYAAEEEADLKEEAPVPGETPQNDNEYGYFGDPSFEQPIAYDDDDPHAPIFYDGYTPESGDQGALTDDEYMPRRVQNRAVREELYESASARHKRRRPAIMLLKLFALLVCCAAMGAGGVLIARHFVLSQGMQMREDNETSIEVVETTSEDGHPAHTITIYGRENATVYLREMQTSYVIADGKVSITVPDYMWYDTESSTFATPVETDTMDVTITPYIRYSQEGDQYQLEPIEYTVDVPLSPIRLINPATAYAEVGVSIFEVRINVELGSTVVIDGTNVSTLIRAETGNVSKNVQVLPVGDNTISISVKSKYCRENKMEVTLHRPAQEIPLELDATVIVEWNYEPITEEKYNAATDEEKQKMNIPTISGTTLPGADITVEFPHWNLQLDKTTGKFSFTPLFSTLGDNDVVIRASYEGMADSVITHTVYYMPNADIYTRKAWDLDSQYTDLLNYIDMRRGTIYVGTGTIQRIISTAPQMAIMNIGTDDFEKLVMIENSSKTTWVEGTRYRVYGDAYGLYNTMPRLTVRYTYLEE